jgi:hypothetical protein
MNNAASNGYLMHNQSSSNQLSQRKLGQKGKKGSKKNNQN